MLKIALSVFAIASFAASSAMACGVEGTAVNSDGSKINGTGTISTSWNSKKAFPRSGSYRLDLGGSVCGSSITVYLDGNQGQRVRVPSSGYAWVSFVRR